jgi:hypothetical protein
MYRCRDGRLAETRLFAPDTVQLAPARRHVERMWEHFHPATVPFAISSAQLTMVADQHRPETVHLAMAVGHDAEGLVDLAAETGQPAVVTVPLAMVTVHETMVTVHETMVTVHVTMMGSHDGGMTGHTPMALAHDTRLTPPTRQEAPYEMN